MPLEIEPVAPPIPADIKKVFARVDAGYFYMRDALFYLYSSKKTILLEDIRTFLFDVPFIVKEIIAASVIDAGGVGFNLGYGSDYGREFGGVYLFDSQKLAVKLDTTNKCSQTSLSATSRIEINLNRTVWEHSEEVVLINDGPRQITVGYTSHNATPNFFGIDPVLAENALLLVRQQEPPRDVDGNLVTPSVIGQAYSFETETSTQEFFDYADVLAAHASDFKLSIRMAEADITDFYRLSDIIFFRFKNKVLKYKTATDLPLVTNFPFGVAAFIEDTNNFRIRTEAGYVVRTTMPIQAAVDLKFNIKFDIGLPGIVQGDRVFVQPDDFENPNYFNAPNDEKTTQLLLEFWDGIPPGTKMIVNKQIFILESAAADIAIWNTQILTAANNPIGVYETQINHLSSALFANSNITATLLNQYATEYVPNYKLFLHDAEIKYILPSEPFNKAPVIITDFSAQDIDAAEFTNVEFAVRGKEIQIFRARNMIYNPSFHYPFGLDAWTVSNTTLSFDTEKIEALLHDQAARIETFGYIRQHIAGINPAKDYTLSFYCRSNGGTVTVNLYAFNNAGVKFTTEPLIGTAIQTLNFTPKNSPSDWKKFTVRIHNSTDFNSQDENQFQLPSGIAKINALTTDTIIEINHVTGGDPLFVDCIQLEQGIKASEFSSNYDFLMLEYESSDKDYMVPIVLSNVINHNNNGFLYIDVKSIDLSDSPGPDAAGDINNRIGIMTRTARRMQGKIRGKNKWRQVGVPSPKRIEHLGEFFLNPRIFGVDDVTILSQPIKVQQSDSFKTERIRALVKTVVEDENDNPLPSRRVTAIFGRTKLDVIDSIDVLTAEDGVAYFRIPGVYQEEVSPQVIMEMEGGIQPDVEFKFGEIFSGSVSEGGGVLTINTPTENYDIGGYLWFSNIDGKFSRLFQITNVTGTDPLTVTYGAAVADPVLTGPVSSSQDQALGTYTHVHASGLLPAEYIRFPSEYQYDLSPTNTANAVVAYSSGVNYQEIPVYRHSETRDSSIYVISKYYKTIPIQRFYFGDRSKAVLVERTYVDIPDLEADLGYTPVTGDVSRFTDKQPNYYLEYTGSEWASVSVVEGLIVNAADVVDVIIGDAISFSGSQERKLKKILPSPFDVAELSLIFEEGDMPLSRNINIAQAAPSGQSFVLVYQNDLDLVAGDNILIGISGNQESAEVLSTAPDMIGLIQVTKINLAAAMTKTHTVAEAVIQSIGPAMNVKIRRDHPNMAVFEYLNNHSINPISGHIIVKDNDNKKTVFYESNTIKNTDRYFFIDHGKKQILISDRTIDEIEVNSRNSKVFVDNKTLRTPGVHRSLFHEAYKSIRTLLDTTEIFNQPEFNPVLGTQNWPIYIRLYVDIQVYVTTIAAQSSDDAIVVFKNLKSR